MIYLNNFRVSIAPETQVNKRFNAIPAPVGIHNCEEKNASLIQVVIEWSNAELIGLTDCWNMPCFP